MDRELILNAKQLNKRRQRKKLWQRAVSILGCIVVFCTTYALILPAITQEREAFCGLEEHTHGENCYSQVTQKHLTCTPESLGLHVHSPDCYNAGGLLSCGQADFVVHTHNEACYDSTGTLVCLLPEREAHIHSEECYILQGGHSHGEECYKVTRGSLVCRETEDPGHTHGQSCYTAGEKLLCTQEENHLHGEACYAPGALQCIWKENHVHGEGCTGNVLKCTLPQDESHTHEAACYETQIICENPENHTHGADCYEKLTVCTIPEGHTHGASCYEQVLQCQTPETPGHTHGDECYEQLRELICTLEEAPGQKLLACTQPEAQVHVHGDACFQTVEAPLTCTVEAGEDHTHGAMCYGTWELVCTMKEHTHSLICYSNPEADVETAEDWEKTLADIKLTGRWAEDVLAIAESQLGYKESTSNYIVEEGEVLKGYTRYGAWYGIPYGDWCAMYASFCLQYAGVEGIPAEASVSRWIALLSEEEYDLYKPAGAYVPQPGDLVFFDWEQDGDPDHVGFVAELLEATQTEPLKIKTIEGNSGNTVRHVTYEMSDPDILGFATLPWQPSAQEQAQIDAVIAQIDAMPSADEIDAKMLEYEKAEDEEGLEAWYTSVCQQVARAYKSYSGLSDLQKTKVTNAEKLLELEYIWSVTTLDIFREIPVTAVNTFTHNAGCGSVIVHSDSGTTVGNSGMAEKDFLWWYAVVIEKTDGYFRVKEIYDEMGVSKSEAYASKDGFILLYHTETLGLEVEAAVGDYVTLSSSFWKTASAHTGTVYGTVAFSTELPGQLKTGKDNTEKLEIVEGADTRNLIEVNLYDYNDQINAQYNADNRYPGFQQDNGTVDSGSTAVFGPSTFNFGNNITSDLDAGIESLTNQGGDINRTESELGGVIYGTANIPISGAISPVLMGGYPALADGTSLEYLFTTNTYATKKNTENINGLFLYDPETGAYTFNSRDNHAQFSGETNTFTLYKQMISSNFMMYPFGNFLPFNDITKLSAQAKTIDREYLVTIAENAAYKYMQGYGEEYNTLAVRLKEYIRLMDSAYGTQWDAYDAVNRYFSTMGLKAAFSGSEPVLPDGTPLMENLYSIDYDEPTNFFFGMEMKMKFYQPRNGKTGIDYNQDMVFQFSGDDDVWVYLDGAMFLDLSGIHRHVGGTIDFAAGKIHYFNLDVDTGDVAQEPYKTVTFEEAFRAAYAEGSQELETALSSLNEKGTFKDYTTHSFNFYYMERGAGSGVCRMNFNFPLLRQNTVAVEKELTADTDVAALGNPSYPFQILAANADGTKTETLFIDPGTPYALYDTDGTVIQEIKVELNPDGSIMRTTVVDAEDNEIEASRILKTDANGVLWLKAGQKAEFVGIGENAGKYFVRELLDKVTLPQFGQITVSGSTTTKVENVTVGGTSFTGQDGPVTDMSAGATLFCFTNKITTAKLSSLSISKTLSEYGASRGTKKYDIRVTLDGLLLPVGTAYTVGAETRRVETAGIITINQNETAVISKILAGSQFTVQETSGSAQGYYVTYLYEGGDSVSVQEGKVVGRLKTDADVMISIENAEKGATVMIPGTKSLRRYDGTEHTYTMRLTQVTDSTGKTPVEAAPEFTKTIAVTDVSENFAFELKYVLVDMNELPQTVYYRLTEDPPDDGTALPNDTVYIVEVGIEAVTGDDGSQDIEAAVKKLWKGTMKDGIPTGLTEYTGGADFINTLAGSLTVSKTVSGPDTDRAFGFTVTLTPGDSNTDPLTGEVTFPAKKLHSEGKFDDIQVTFTDGTAAVSLKHGESLAIRDIPYGMEWTVTETDADGFAVTTTVTSGETVTPGEGITTGGSILAGSTAVAYRNTAVYKLPETGGTGTTLYTMAGLALMGSALCLKYIPSKRRKGGKSS